MSQIDNIQYNSTTYDTVDAQMRRNTIPNILNNFGTIETTTASKSYLIGETVIINGILYNVTSAISQGDTFVPGTNIIESKIMLNALPQAIKIPLPDLVGIGGLYNNSFCYKVGATVCVVIDIELTGSGRYYENILRLPEGYRPDFTIRHGVKSFDHPSYTSEYVEIKSDGYINLQTYVSEAYGTGQQYKFPLAYVCRFDVFAS